MSTDRAQLAIFLVIVCIIMMSTLVIFQHI